MKAKNSDIEIIGLQPIEGSQIPGIRRWPEAYRPSIFDPTAVDHVIDVSQARAEETMRQMAREEEFLRAFPRAVQSQQRSILRKQMMGSLL